MLSVKLCKIHIKSVNAITTPSLKKKFAEFVEFKKNHPREPFGSSDKPYSKSGNFSGYSHAHLTFDMVVNYKIDGQCLYLYGVLSKNSFFSLIINLYNFF